MKLDLNIVFKSKSQKSGIVQMLRELANDLEAGRLHSNAIGETYNSDGEPISYDYMFTDGEELRGGSDEKVINPNKEDKNGE